MDANIKVMGLGETEAGVASEDSKSKKDWRFRRADVFVNGELLLTLVGAGDVEGE